MGTPASDSGLATPNYATKPITFLKDAILSAVSFVEKGANGQRWLLLKSAEAPEPSYASVMPLVKSAPTEGKSWTTAYVRLAVPGEVDKQNDVWTEDEIRKACHDFTASGGLINLDHATMDRFGDLVESWIAPVDMELPTPEGPETIIKGTWVVGVRPTNDEVYKKIDSGEISGLSVQGSARREEVPAEEVNKLSKIAKAYTDDRSIPKGTEGPGMPLLQRALGVEETGTYDDATEAALTLWMSKRGTPGQPTLATVKSVLESVKPPAPAVDPTVGPDAQAPQAAAAPSAAAASSVEAVKADTGYDPATQDYGQTNYNLQDGAKVGPSAGNLGLDADQINVDSPADDLKAALAKSLQEGNDDLVEYMQERFGGYQVGDLYGQEISQPDLWFMYSKFVQGTGRMQLDANGDLVSAGQDDPSVEKGAWTGSMGGHDPDAHRGNEYNFIRTFGEWAKGKESIAAKVLLAHGVVKTIEAANRLAAWLKDQWENNTHWRTGRKGGALHKSDDLAAICAEHGLDPETVVAALNSPDFLAHAQAHVAEADTSATQDPANDTIKQIAQVLQSGGSSEQVMAQVKEVLANRPKGLEGAGPALKKAISEATQAPEGERDAAIDAIVEDFTRYAKHALSKSEESFSDAPAEEEATVNPHTFPEGEELDMSYSDEDRAKLSAAAEAINSILGGGDSEAATSAEVEKAKPVKGDPVPAAPATADDESKEDPAEEAAETPDEEKAEDGEEVTPDEVVQVLNHVVETMDGLTERVAQLEGLEKKLDQVGELAKALNVTDQIDVLDTAVTELSKKLDTVVSSDEMEAVRKKLEDLANEPGTPSALAPDAVVAEDAQVEEVAKSDVNLNDPASLWGNTFR